MIPVIQNNRNKKRCEEEHNGKNIHCFSINVYREESFNKIFYIGSRQVIFAHSFEDRKVPVRERAITIAVKYPEKKPWKTSEKQGYQIDQPCFPANPSKKIKENKQGMKDDEKEIQ